jgi:hypothetical protein
MPGKMCIGFYVISLSAMVYICSGYKWEKFMIIQKGKNVQKKKHLLCTD